MPFYEYEHLGAPCDQGQVIEVKQPIHDLDLRTCPHCGGPVRKLMTRVHFKKTRSDSELRDLGFTKLVRRDEGLFENMTARDGESRMVDRTKPETFPDLSKTIED